jgi:hypothetical protein
MGKPSKIGIENVRNPNVKLLFLYFLNSFMSSSNPAINMIYSKPMVENNLTDPSDSSSFSPIKLNPFGPIITPEIIRPMIEGILIFLSRIGDNRMMKRISEKINTGFFKGN